MKNMFKITAATFLALGLASGASAMEFTKGTVKKVDAKAKKVTLIHEELKSLDMPAMTMVFRVKDEALFEKMKVGSTIEFVADRLEGKLTVIELK
ncbi:MAG: copper-binding protein [Hoeflea sp.]|uniref:copper-binding protein n=1 Tax=Hoeflea sp. TaxID=1940281 RepID=UPI001DFAD5B7|nr:copper-binding protein [Hoeflea sp.]MBU4529302.1 copper-binding protein [Alphaproteobacteria bacterium]MBU4545469.1 copper-binding protein [Alphaproteobacteria bacterium]MBU4550184.1 copper-binding protein [Alphaproteobacteria bacterium]MBV1723225.1 copper-binding protein [Hoeflea sp.]MBV1782898.1 copper-binding protein [Hoeflea sp.]